MFGFTFLYSSEPKEEEFQHEFRVLRSFLLFFCCALSGPRSTHGGDTRRQRKERRTKEPWSFFDSEPIHRWPRIFSGLFSVECARRTNGQASSARFPSPLKAQVRSVLCVHLQKNEATMALRRVEGAKPCLFFLPDAKSQQTFFFFFLLSTLSFSLAFQNLFAPPSAHSSPPLPQTKLKRSHALLHYNQNAERGAAELLEQLQVGGLFPQCNHQEQAERRRLCWRLLVFCCCRSSLSPFLLAPLRGPRLRPPRRPASPAGAPCAGTRAATS